MEKKIMFRAWDKELKRIFEVADLDFSEWWVRCSKPEGDPKENGGNYYGERNSFSNEETDRHILMQYTGVKDKNGKMIFEGDILKYEWKDKEVIDFIEFRPAMFTYSGSIRINLDQDEVIGNIYENPELLEI